jgi:protein SCO1/2
MNAPIEENTPSQDATHRPSNAPGSAVPYILSFVVLVAMLYAGWKWWQTRQFDLGGSQPVSADVVGPPLKEFELTERSGQPFRSTEMRGRVWVASYFFITCAGTCARVAANLKRLHDMPDMKDVSWVSITCDPDTDTLETLRNHANLLHADPERWLFCRADLEYTKRVALGMRLYLSYKDHQDRVVVIDKSGKIRGYFDATSTRACDEMHDLLLKCLSEEPPRNLVSSGMANGKSS